QPLARKRRARRRAPSARPSFDVGAARARAPPALPTTCPVTSSLPSQPRSARVRRHVHRGVVEAAALLLADTFAGPLATRGRAVAAWSPGSTVYRLGDVILVRFPSPRWIDCARAPGLPLVRAGAALSSAPLEPDELNALAPPAGAVVLVRGGAPSCV